ncbi:MAG: hypothetical protein LIR50_13050 [Bacillota bacterium]|nr:hypothetical protein [Bacillota bacterium]
MNKFDRAVNKKTCELIFENFPDQEVDEETYKKFLTIARAMIRTEMRGIKQSDNPKSLYQKTWKTANKYGDLKKTT